MPATRIKGIDIGDATVTEADISLASASVVSPIAAHSFVMWDTANAVLKTSPLANVEDYFDTKYALINHSHLAFTGNTAVANGAAGMVPQPLAGTTDKVLSSGGAWLPKHFFAVTPAGDTAGRWTATVAGINSYYDGLRVTIYNTTTYNGTYNTLNINGLGEALVWYRPGSRLTSHFGAANMLTMTYSSNAGTYSTFTGGFVLDSVYQDGSESYTVRYNYYNPMSGASGMPAYKMFGLTPAGIAEPFTTTAGTGTTKVINTATYNLSKGIFIYQYSSNTAANTRLNAAYVHASISTSTLNYTHNNITPFTAYEPFYLVADSFNGDAFTLDDSSLTALFTQTLPTTDNGKYYIYLGRLYNTINNFILEPFHPVYYYKDGALRIYNNTYIESSSHAHTLDSLSNVTITANSSGEILKWNGSAWINNTLAEAGIEPAFSKNTAFNKNFGTTAGTVAEGNHTHAYGTGTVTSVSAGNGMNFSTITASGAVTMGTPSTLTAATTNAVTANSHTHAITGFETTIAAGTTSQYWRGDKTWQAFPTIPTVGSLVTTSTTALATSAGESFGGTINLHKISKTGTYSDLIGKPTIPTVTPSALTIGSNDTNITLSVGGSAASALLAAASVSVAWAGTLADGRIASATNWNTAYTHATSTPHQTIINGTGFVKASGTTLSYDNSTYLTGTKVDSFNTRTGAVSLTKADVEAVLTGVITTHSHNPDSGTIPNYVVSDLAEFTAAYNTIRASYDGGDIYVIGDIIMTADLTLDLSGINIYGVGGKWVFHNGHLMAPNSSELFQLIITHGSPTFDGMIFWGSDGSSSYSYASGTTRNIINITPAVGTNNISKNITFRNCRFADIVCGVAGDVIVIDAVMNQFASIYINFDNCVVGTHGMSTGYTGFNIAYNNASNSSVIDVNVSGQKAGANDSSALYYTVHTTGVGKVNWYFNSDETAWIDSNSNPGAGSLSRYNTISQSKYSSTLPIGSYLLVSDSATSYNNILRVPTSVLSGYTHPSGFTNQPGTALSGASVISQITVNTEGHVTGVTTRNLSYVDVNAQAELLVRSYSLLGNSSSQDELPPANIGIGTGLGFDANGNLEVTGGGGGLTSVGLSMPNVFSVANSPLTANGTLAVTFADQTKNKVLASPIASTGAPTFRALVATDIPDLSAVYDQYLGWYFKLNGGSATIIGSGNGSPGAGNFNGLMITGGPGITVADSDGGNYYRNLTISKADIYAYMASNQTTASNSTSGVSITGLTLSSIPGGAYDFEIVLITSMNNTAGSGFGLTMNVSNYFFGTIIGSTTNAAMKSTEITNGVLISGFNTISGAVGTIIMRGHCYYPGTFSLTPKMRVVTSGQTLTVKAGSFIKLNKL